MRKIIIIFSSFCLVLLLAYAAYRGYEVWKEKHWMTMARQFAAKGDVHNEFLSLEQALRANSRNIEATRMMANLATGQNLDTALRWRRRVLELAPDSLDDHLALAQTAIFAGQFDTASNALASIDAAGKKTPDYFNLLGELDLVLNQTAEAESAFSEVVRLDPSNSEGQLNLAVIELHRTNDLDKSEGRIALKRISLNSTNISVRSKAKRELIMDALLFKDFGTAVSLSTELAKETNSPFADKLWWLETLRLSKNNAYHSALTYCEATAARNSDEMSQLTSWLIERNASETALGWLRSLPVQVQTNQPAGVLIAQCLMSQADWSGLQKSISKQDWGNADFIRHAFMARAMREQGLSGASKAEWDVAFKYANNRLDALKRLFEYTTSWNWANERQQILWAIVNSFPGEQWAGPELMKALYASGGTRPLMQLFSLQHNRYPMDPVTENNLALTALLLHANELQPNDLARDAYKRESTNATIACTYAFSLYLLGQNEAALKIMQGMPPDALEDNTTAGYYGLILNSVGQHSKARPFLRRSTDGPLLPEERDMFQKALLGI